MIEFLLDNKKDIIHYCLEVIIALTGLYLAFGKSYFTEKGKNLATLEDIEEITSKVEAIKTEFIRETERLKFDLQYTNQIKLSIKSEEIKSLFDFYEKYFFWLNILLDSSFTLINDEVMLRQEKDKINQSYFAFLLAEAKVELLLGDIEELSEAKIMKIATLHLQSYILTKITEYDVKIREKIDRLTKLENLTQAESYELSRVLDDRSDLSSKYNKQKVKRYSSIVKKNRRFQENVNKLINSMSK